LTSDVTYHRVTVNLCTIFSNTVTINSSAARPEARTCVETCNSGPIVNYLQRIVEKNLSNIWKIYEYYETYETEVF